MSSQKPDRKLMERGYSVARSGNHRVIGEKKTVWIQT